MTAALAPIDPMAATRAGRYDDGAIVVLPVAGPPGVHAAVVDGRLTVSHRLQIVDDDLAEQLAVALAPLTDDPDVFGRAFTGIVMTSHDDPFVAWERFYRASLARIDDPTRTGYVEVHRHAVQMLPRTSVLDLGCSFGFLALHLARSGVEVTAGDADPGALRLVDLAATWLELPVRTMLCSGAVPLPDRSVDAVALLHVLEHVDAPTGRALLAEALRIARARVVVAVPYEDAPTPLFGHVRTFAHDDLVRLSAASGWRAKVHDHHGGWLVLDRTDRRIDPSPPAPADGQYPSKGAGT